MYALEYQLHERIPLVPPPDPIVADLLFDLGNLSALAGLEERAAAVLELADRYEGVRPVGLRLSYLRARRSNSK